MTIDDKLNNDENDLAILDKEMEKVAGLELIDRMIKVLDNRDSARKWFYTQIISLGNQRPYDYCKEGKHQEVEDLLGRIEYGVY